ncbi:MAG: LCP family protein [Ruminococcus sp.]|jgi:LCP family protein required for cell wall assembly
MKKKRKVPLPVKILIPILILVLLAGAVFVYAQTKLNKINRVDDSQVEKVDPSEEDFEIDEELAKEIQAGNVDVIDPNEVEWNNVDINVMQDKDVVNILLIGQDRREGQGRQRSDSMIICSINKKSNKIILSSVMRDLYVPIPGYSDNRINAAYQFGGMPLLDQVMEESLGIHIDGNIEVDFEGFISAMTEVGNLDIELYQAEADYLNRNHEGWNLKAGVNSLTPEQALAYSRTRYVGNSDWERTDRQRRVLMAAFDKVKDQGLTELLSMADRILPSLTTDMSNTQIMGYIYTVVTSGITEIESYRIPVEGTYTNETLSIGMEVLMPDLKANSEYLQEYIYGENAASNS